MTKIARYIDDPPQFLLWSIDEILLFALFFGLGIITPTPSFLFSSSGPA